MFHTITVFTSPALNISYGSKYQGLQHSSTLAGRYPINVKHY